MLSTGPSKYPDMIIFKRLQFTWEFIDQSTYDRVKSDEVLYSAVSCLASQVIGFALRQLEQLQPRDGADHHILGLRAFLRYIIQSTSWTAPGKMESKECV